MNDLFLILLGSIFLALGLEPVGSSIASALGLVCLILISEEIKTSDSILKPVRLGLFFSLSITIFAFTWVYTSIGNLTGASWIVSVPVFIIYALFSFYKIFFIFIGAWIYKKILSKEKGSDFPFFLFFGYPSLAVLSDWFSPMVFPVYWGDFFRGNLILRQTVSLSGVEFLSFFGWFLAAGGIYSYRLWRSGRTSQTAKTDKKTKSAKPSLSKTPIYVYLGISSIILFYNIHSLFRVPETSSSLFTAIVQPNTKYATLEKREDQKFIQAALQSVLDLGKEAILRSPKPIDLLVFPESSVPFHGTSSKPESKSTYSPTFLGILEYLSKSANAPVLYNELIIDGKMHNTASLLRMNTRSIEHYYKQNLLPFGEYLPMESSLPVLRKIFPEASSHAPGLRSGLFQISKNISASHADKMFSKNEDLSPYADLIQNPESLEEWQNDPDENQSEEANFTVSPLICYEAMDPGLVLKLFHLFSERNQRTTSPDLLVNLTNDSWFESERETWQHAGSAMLRAVETGTPLIRSAVTGVTRVNDPWGREIVPPGPMEVQTIIYAEIPIIKGGIPTIYRSIGRIPLRIFAILALIFTFLMGHYGYTLSNRI
ncbi:apolipoprotein N-acyltransferase 1 [Leptospira kobayashii]|uniref:Apolipoprotein N-acyltransferase n=1 Tax=Leptospira kobayashii TaxID=1917830 RepID=A0ABM7ULB1_9LEPT|nr:nitrilase-related carbon-nitrogen hydrolase [Leptospira kobayashii]BDA79737.1 apolipoprotein N-acyltransferase 1 [Leptospira kobayashii]